MTGQFAAAKLGHSSESALLLACAQIAPTQVQHHRIASVLAGAVDWERVLEMAEAHGLLALLFRALRADGLPPLPRAVEIRLWTYQEQLRRKNRLMSQELLAILELLSAAGIPAVPYKGPVLAETIYGDLEHREFGDLDLLLPPADIVRARNLLAARGYVPLFALTPALERALLSSPDHYHFALKQQIMVELHWRTDAEFPVADLGDPAWWSIRPNTGFGNRTVPALESHELVLALLLHGSKHLWEQLNWVAELAELLRLSPGMDWQWILAGAERLRARRRVAVGLHLMARNFEATLPLQVRDWIAQEPAAEPLAERIEGSWFARPGERSTSAFQRLFLNLKFYDSEAQGAGHAIRVVLRPGLAEWSRWPLPRPLHFLYLPLRSARLAWKYLSRTK